MVEAALRHVETSVKAAIDLAGSVSWDVFRDGQDSAVMNHVRSVTISFIKMCSLYALDSLSFIPLYFLDVILLNIDLFHALIYNLFFIFLPTSC